MSKTILVVDDTVDLLKSITDFLQMEGYVVLTARNGVEVLDVLKSQLPDLIISDLVMPKMDGYEMLNEVNKINTLDNVPIIFLSATSKELPENKRLIKSRRNSRFINKPCSIEIILETIEELTSTNE